MTPPETAGPTTDTDNANDPHDAPKKEASASASRAPAALPSTAPAPAMTSAPPAASGAEPADAFAASAGASHASIKPDAGPASGASGRPDVHVRLFARTDVGQVREHNEDNFVVSDLSKRQRGLAEGNRPSLLGPQGALFAVCDGMGGAAAGEVASQLAVDILIEKMSDGLDERPTGRDEIARRLVRAVESAGLRIFQEAKADRSRRGMGTTVTASALVDDHLFLAQVGDSRGYILRGDQLVQVTRDQSLVNQLIEAGQLTEEEAETFEHNNIILQALGTSDTVAVDLTYVELKKGDTLMLCSDGLSGMVRFDDIREILKSSKDPLEICKSLTERANQAGGHDNITVIVAQFDGAGLAEAKPTDETLRYKKYLLPEEAPEPTEPGGRRSQKEIAAAAAAGSSAADDDDDAPESGMAPAAQPSGASVATATASDAWHERGTGSEMEERIDIPGTHVPAWVVIALIAGVVLLIGGTAVLLLH